MFQQQFVDAIRSGAKTQTIRKTARCKAGDMLSLRHWADKAYRSKQILITMAQCQSVEDVCIDWRGVIIGSNYCLWPKMDDFAQSDGFANFKAMCEWFESTHGLPFCGQVIKWRVSRSD